MPDRSEEITQYIPRLRRYARALVKDPDRAEDLLQETLARALGKFHFWRAGSNLRAWLFTIMHNQFVNDCRRSNKRPDGRYLDDISGPEASACGDAEDYARVTDIEAAIMRLPDEQRAVLLLVSLEGLSYADTARVLGIRKGTVMSRLHRARERVRSLMSDAAGGDVDYIRRVK